MRYSRIIFIYFCTKKRRAAFQRLCRNWALPTLCILILNASEVEGCLRNRSEQNMFRKIATSSTLWIISTLTPLNCLNRNGKRVQLQIWTASFRKCLRILIQVLSILRFANLARNEQSLVKRFLMYIGTKALEKCLKMLVSTTPPPMSRRRLDIGGGTA